MALGLGGAILSTIMYQGIKEAWRFTYIPPAMRKGVPGNSGWEELRFRHPSPASAPHKGFHNRADPRFHYKTSYMTSKYNIRKYWDEEFERGHFTSGTWMPPLASFSEPEQAKFLDYVEGDAEGNAIKKQQYEDHYKRTRKQELSTTFDGMMKSLVANPEVFHDLFRDGSLEWRCQDVLEMEDDFEEPKNLPPLPLDKQYRMEYWLYYWPSFELQLQLELDFFLETSRDRLQENGVPSYAGNRYLWQAGGGILSESEINKLNSWLKLRHPTRPQP